MAANFWRYMKYDLSLFIIAGCAIVMLLWIISSVR